MDVDISRIQLLTQSLAQRADASVVAKVLSDCDLSQADIEPPATHYSAHQEALFVRHACDELDDITFGARAGLEFSSSSSITAYISKYSRDLRQVMENTTRFHGIIDPALAFSLRVSGNSASLEADWKDPGFSRYHRRTEFMLFAAIARMRALTQQKLNPIEIRFQHDVGQHADTFQKIGGFPVSFGTERLEIILSLPSLEIQIPTYDLSLRAHLLEYCERLLAERRSPKQKTRSQIEGLITRSMPGGIVQADEAAAQLGLSTRTLARRLTDEGTSYREVVEDLRCDLAQTFIKNGMNLTEISYSLGYSDQAAFSTAFKRWTGQAPSAFRKRVSHPLSQG
ncbi:Helix-turn-helix domain-containing protein [Ruegeria halocynthiae]|uniref:Helix-turn-helix domain-containing protein n=1 Tax=Ruegeria halocynthiae TaxID=985054 RepID=A0A1H2RWH0_9RHOB|nr:AraC family transcriptional regulator [Ruegeria halocynthiae]SDW23648.1 Helix-turn-helix domain-containing protein [Ruegeria halocynthiae]